MPSVVCFRNARLCVDGQLHPQAQFDVDTSTGKIIERSQHPDHITIDLKNAIVAPGFLELQTNGSRGFHFTHFTDAETYTENLTRVAEYLPRTGVTAFYPTVPTVASQDFKKILPCLAPHDLARAAAVLGAHAEGPYLQPLKKGAHNASLFQLPTVPPEHIYGQEGLAATKVVTLAPENEGSLDLIKNLTQNGIMVSLGHSNATYHQGLAAVEAGAKCLTHTLNAMAPLHHRDPGLTGLVATPSTNSPFFSIIADGNHLHPSVATVLFRSNAKKCVLITDSIELAGLPDGTYPGHAQIPFNQTKLGSKVGIEGTETLVGGCASLSECVQNLVKWSECGIAEAVRCVTENVANLMALTDRGMLEPGRRADFVVLDDEANVLQTWIGGVKVWDLQHSANN
ncbi:carbohydrate esterase family 9 protein [Pseudocercospora fijiensis CIRAD86]|uniref:N-acetylglucosamine-6-phosphate deacetylase n=1 Tax=Pseudocercospora fijiensis (strain CIRAD86) TaxID=383855 RepID=N1QB22_PSEFD|nr:carbohydrate esterase family 9 protein [Pseudocercospora fijiensis CIRAD86]EME88312.1 carbohydrate esterase family 9 protein [Pseudocercospora fijiensis CIRAD86]